MNHLGGKRVARVMLSDFPGFSLGITLVNGHPGTKGPMFTLSEEASSAATWYNGSALTK